MNAKEYVSNARKEAKDFLKNLQASFAEQDPSLYEALIKSFVIGNLAQKLEDKDAELGKLRNKVGQLP